MQDNESAEHEPSVEEKLHDIVDRMLAPFDPKSPRSPPTILGRLQAPFDYSKPNEHDSKAEFQREMDVVSKSLDHLGALIGLLGSRDGDENHADTLKQLNPIIDWKLFRLAPNAWIDNPLALIQKNVADVGGSTASRIVLMDLWVVLGDRLGELKNQEEIFWNLPHRAPDHFARAIALRLARLFARETGQRPTFGTSGETGDLSTSYARALKEVFDLLDIKAAARLPAEWAIQQLTDQDQQPVVNHLMNFGWDLGQPKG